MSGSDDRSTKVVYAANADLNQAQNTVLLTYVAAKPVRIHRFGVIADAAEGLLAPMDLKLRKTPISTGTAADVSGAVLNGAVKARGFGLMKTLTSREVVAAGDTITVTSETAAGGTSTGLVFLEVEELPFSGANVANVEESA